MSRTDLKTAFAAKPKRRMAVALLGMLIVAATTVLLCSCATTIVPPAKPQNPATVYLLDHGRTPSLVLPGEDEQMQVRYVYGDWNYYALRKNDFGHGVAAIFWPTTGALGRKQIARTNDVNEMLRRFNVGVEVVYDIQVEQDAVSQLRQRLDEIFNANIDSLIVNEPYSLEFVHHPQRYTFASNSNHEVAQWMRELGCETRGWTMFSNWKVQ